MKQSHPFSSAFAGEKENNTEIIRLNFNGTIDVNIVSCTKTLDVNLSDIRTLDELDVNIDEIGGR